MLASGLAALVSLALPVALQAVLLAGAAAAYLMLMTWVDGAWRRSGAA